MTCEFPWFLENIGGTLGMTKVLVLFPTVGPTLASAMSEVAAARVFEMAGKRVCCLGGCFLG